MTLSRSGNEQERFSETYEKFSKSEKVWKIDGNVTRRSEAVVVGDQGKCS